MQSANTDDATIVKSIISLAHNLGMKVIAEGVETKEQLEFLRLYDCDEVQGYLIGKPELPAKYKHLYVSEPDVSIK